MRAAAALAFLTAALAGTGPSAIAQAPRGADHSAAAAIARARGVVRVIVRLHPRPSVAPGLGSTSPSLSQMQNALQRRLAGRTVRRVRNFSYVPYTAMEVDEVTLRELALSPEVASIRVDQIAEPTLAESTSRIGAPAAWSAGYTGAGWSIAVLDTGVDRNHPFLANKVVSEACYSTTLSGFSNSVCPEGAAVSTAPDSARPCTVSTCEHGTHVAGIAAGAGSGFSGVAPGASLIAIQVFSSMVSDCGSRPAPCAASFESDIMAGLERVYALRQSHRIASVNLSLGRGLFPAACDNEPIKEIVDRLRAAGIATVVSSGNDGSASALSWPACVSSAISVGSTTDGVTEEVSSFTNSNAQLTLLAPGEIISSAVPGGGFSAFGGTSMAAPHVSGAWAVLRSEKPEAGVTEILDVLRRTGVSVYDPANGLWKPRVRLDAAFESLRPCTYTVTPVSMQVPSEGASVNVQVNTGSACGWSASTDASFVSLASASSMQGPGTLRLAVAANPFPRARRAMVVAAGAAVAIEQPGSPAGDVDGRPNLIWQHTGDGTLATWSLDGGTVLSSRRLNIPTVSDLNWRVVGGGDLNADSRTDLVWRHESDGRLAVWYLNAGAVLGTEHLSIDRVADLDWQIRGVGDTNGDGFADLVWQHRTRGSLAVWFMNGSRVTGTHHLSVNTIADRGWEIAGAGDVNADGKADLVWQHAISGHLAVWLMNGSTVGEQRLLTIPAVPDLRWKVRGVGDANGDGRADLLWQNGATGELAAWFLNGHVVIGTTRMTQGVGPASSWLVVGPG